MEVKHLIMINNKHYESIDRLWDNSSPHMSRIMVRFKNGRKLSLIRGFGSHGYEDDLFEVMTTSEITETEDGVLGHLSVEEVNDIIEKVGRLQ